MATYYSHSGKIPLSGLLLTAAIGVFAATVMGIAYAYVMYYIESIKLHAIFPFLFGCGIGCVVGWAARLGHLRSKVVPALVGLMAAVVGLYAAWGADCLARMGAPNGDWLLPFQPDFLKAYITEFYDKGFWSFGHGPNAEMVSGVWLAFYWSIEAIFILAGGALFAWVLMDGVVYCEQCGRWTRRDKSAPRLSFAMSNEAMGQVAAGEIAPLLALPRAEGTDRTFIRLNTDSCESCSETNFVTVELVNAVPTKKKGKYEFKAMPIVSKLQIASEDLKRIKNAGV